MTSPRKDCALVILGHGSTENPDSSTPTQEHAEDLRARGLFAEVHTAFWKEEPSFRQVWPLIESPVAYFVPDFISEGYFTQQVIPRELELSGRITQHNGTTAYYCDPVGVHASMTQLLLKRAREIAGDVPPEETSLIIVGHGTSLNTQSTQVIKDQAARLNASGGGYAEVLDAYMEEPPFIADWHQMAQAPNVVVVPFFISDGLHSYQDIPVLLGIESEPTEAASQRDVFRENPHRLRGKTLYYSRAIGTDPSISDIILDQVTHFDEEYLRDR